MASHSTALLSLCECLRGAIPQRPDWLSLIGLANETLTTPALIDFVDRFDQSLPEDVRSYVRDICQRNQIRNDRLTAQITEAVAALNDCGVTPTLLKGAATLATAPRRRRRTKIMADLDLMVEPDQVRTAIEALSDIGYAIDSQTPADSEEWRTDLKRSQDVGMIDLHRSLPGPAYFYSSSGHVLDHCQLTSIGPGSAYVPTPTYQAFLLTIHDQFQDYDYWVGGIDLRHLLDLRSLTDSPDGIHWDLLASLAPSRLARNALESQLVALAELLGVDVPLSMCSRFIPRLQFKRRLVQARFPIARWPLLAATVLDYRNYRRGVGAEYRRASRCGNATWTMPRPETLWHILEMTANHRIGKI
ncbi:nucleotidyltransferase family protein [Bradyrhizobium sp. 180]|uniref:nucleotidyltransferase family protein n=1 Tax=Bradyrhizobium sp. 180 TaxID=2782650 RepID=UPI001FFBAA56|nr:nucleotidyltransferase family protein [Bradyrhizobium sp. 180]MCK1495201.1 nucleotidyltransferase family protein [Bradyrhizobium sp. 180]